MNPLKLGPLSGRRLTTATTTPFKPLSTFTCAGCTYKLHDLIMLLPERRKDRRQQQQRHYLHDCVYTGADSLRRHHHHHHHLAQQRQQGKQHDYWPFCFASSSYCSSPSYSSSSSSWSMPRTSGPSLTDGTLHYSLTSSHPSSFCSSSVTLVSPAAAASPSKAKLQRRRDKEEGYNEVSHCTSAGVREDEPVSSGNQCSTSDHNRIQPESVSVGVSGKEGTSRQEANVIPDSSSSCCCCCNPLMCTPDARFKCGSNCCTSEESSDWRTDTSRIPRETVGNVAEVAACMSRTRNVGLVDDSEIRMTHECLTRLPLLSSMSVYSRSRQSGMGGMLLSSLSRSSALFQQLLKQQQQLLHLAASSRSYSSSPSSSSGSSGKGTAEAGHGTVVTSDKSEHGKEEPVSGEIEKIGVDHGRDGIRSGESIGQHEGRDSTSNLSPEIGGDGAGGKGRKLKNKKDIRKSKEQAKPLSSSSSSSSDSESDGDEDDGKNKKDKQGHDQRVLVKEKNKNKDGEQRLDDPTQQRWKRTTVGAGGSAGQEGSVMSQNNKDKKEDSSEDDGDASDVMNRDEVLTYLRSPKKVKFGVFKVLLTIIAGIYAGAFLAKFGANLLEEYEIFVKDDDDDD